MNVVKMNLALTGGYYFSSKTLGRFDLENYKN